LPAPGLYFRPPDFLREPPFFVAMSLSSLKLRQRIGAAGCRDFVRLNSK
jgi:hypothetical protein